MYLSYVGDFLLFVSALSCAVGLVLDRLTTWLYSSCICACVLACGAILLGVHVLNYDAFLGVWANSHASLPWFYRLASAWTYYDGSYLIWVSCVAFVFLSRLIVFKSHKLGHNEAFIWFVILFSQLLVLLLTAKPFAILANSPTEGLGFNPTLHSNHVVFHPPILYMGLALLLPQAVIALSKHSTLEGLARFYNAWAHIVLTLGLFLGGVWAYHELGWGGMWFWDPVETLALIPWVANLMLFHIWQRNPKRAKIWAPLPFACVLWQIWGVRSGSVISVHSFAQDSERGLFLLIVALAFSFFCVFHFLSFRKNTLFKSQASTTIFLGIIVVLIAGVTIPMLANIHFDAEAFHTLLLPLIAWAAFKSSSPALYIKATLCACFSLIGYAYTPAPSWQGGLAIFSGVIYIIGSLRSSLQQKLGHMAFGFFLISLAWKSTWSYEVYVHENYDSSFLTVQKKYEEKISTTFGTKHIVHLLVNGSPTSVEEHYTNRGTRTYKMGTIRGVWSHWQVAPLPSQAHEPKKFLVGYRHGIHGVWLTLVLLTLSISWKSFGLLRRREKY